MEKSEIKKGGLYWVSIQSKEFCLLTLELNKMNLKNRQSEFNLCYWDVMKLKNKAKKHLRNSFLEFKPQKTRLDCLKLDRVLYPNHTIKDLQNLGFKI